MLHQLRSSGYTSDWRKGGSSPGPRAVSRAYPCGSLWLPRSACDCLPKASVPTQFLSMWHTGWVTKKPPPGDPGGQDLLREVRPPSITLPEGVSSRGETGRVRLVLEGGGVWDPGVCVPKMARKSLLLTKF